MAPGQPLQHLQLALGQRLCFRLSGRLGRRMHLKRLHHLARNVAGHGRTPIKDFPDRFENFGGAIAFNQIAKRSRGEGLEHLFPLLEHGQHDDFQLRRGAAKAGHTVNATHAGQIDVHEHDIGGMQGDVCQCGFRIRIGFQAAKA